MDKITVLSVGLHGQVLAIPAAEERGGPIGDLGSHTLLVPSGLVSDEANRRAATALAERTANHLAAKPGSARALLVLPLPLPDAVTAILAETFDAAGIELAAVIVRSAVARLAAADAEAGSLAGAWLLDAAADGFALVGLEGDQRVSARQSFDLLLESRRRAVAEVFRAEHQMDIKHAGGSPERIEAWLERLQREGRLVADRTVAWELPDGTTLDVRATPLRDALEGMHAGAILAIENACLEAVTEEPGSILVGSSVESWFHIATTLRASLPGTQVGVLENTREAELVERWLQAAETAGAGRTWVVRSDLLADPHAVTWKMRGRKRAAPPDAPAAPPAPESKAPAPPPAPPPQPPVAPPPAAPRRAEPPVQIRRAAAAATGPSPEARPRTPASLIALVAIVLVSQVGLVAWVLSRGTSPTAGPEAAGLREQLNRIQASLIALQTSLDERLTPESLEPVYQEIESLRGASAAGDAAATAAALASLSSSNDELIVRVDGLQAGVTDLGRGVEKLRSARAPDAGEGTGAVAALVGSVDANRESLNTLQAEADRLGERLDRADQDVLALGERVDEIEPASGAAGAAGAAAGVAFVARLDDQQADLAALRGDVDRWMAATPLSGDGVDLDDLERRLGAAETRLSERKSRTDEALGGLRTEVEDLRGTLAASTAAESTSEVQDGALYADLAAQRLRAFNDENQRVVRAGSDGEGHGSLRVYNDQGERAVLIGATSGGRAGYLSTFHENGTELFKVTSHSASGAGYVGVSNTDGQRRISLTISEEDDGVLRISDRDGKVVEVIGGGGDLAEAVRPAAGRTLRPGQVVRVVGADDGGAFVAPTETAYDAGVLGIVSEAGPLRPALLLNSTGSEAERAVALAGQVYCLADAGSDAIRPGDLLTSSGRTGHAMRADPEIAPQGSIVGKALEGLDEGTGLIRVWVLNR